SLNTVFQAVDVPTQEALRIVQISTQTAVATRSSVETLTDILLAAKNALNIETGDLLQFSDKLITMWRDGVITFEHAGNALGKVFQAANLFGAKTLQEMDTVLAAVAAVTKQAGSTERNVTYLQNVMLEFTEPKRREKLQKAGVDFDIGDTTFE